jgi:hypothetical protein
MLQKIFIIFFESGISVQKTHIPGIFMSRFWDFCTFFVEQQDRGRAGVLHVCRQECRLCGFCGGPSGMKEWIPAFAGMTKRQ